MSSSQAHAKSPSYDFDEFNLSIERSAAQPDHLRVRLLYSEVAQQDESDVVPVLLPQQLITEAQDFKLLYGTAAEGLRIGAALAEVLFPPSLLELLHRAYRHLKGLRVLRIRLGFAKSAEDCQSLPWELLATHLTPDGPIEHLGRASNIVLVRYRISKHDPPPRRIGRPDVKFRVLSLLSNPDPKGLGPVNYKSEKKILVRGKEAGAFSVQFAEPPRRGDFLRGYPSEVEIFHFAGHGAIDDPYGKGRTAGLYFAKPTAGHDFIEAQEIADQARRRDAGLAVLNACHSATVIGRTASDLPAAFARAGIHIVIGYSTPVNDKTAAICLKNIAQSLLSGDTFEHAVIAARTDLLTEFPETCRWASLVIYARPGGAAFLEPVMDDSDGSTLKAGAKSDRRFLNLLRKWLLPLSIGPALLLFAAWSGLNRGNPELFILSVACFVATALLGAGLWYLIVRQLLGARTALLERLALDVERYRETVANHPEMVEAIRPKRTLAMRTAWHSSRTLDSIIETPAQLKENVRAGIRQAVATSRLATTPRRHKA